MQNLYQGLPKDTTNDTAILAMRAKIMQSMGKSDNKQPQPMPMRNYLMPTYGQEPQI
jgi:hypothetical protein